MIASAASAAAPIAKPLPIAAVVFNPAFNLAEFGHLLEGPQVNYVTHQAFEWTPKHSARLVELESAVDYRGELPFWVYVDRDDEVIVPAPYWVSYPDMVKLADGQPAILNCTAENEFKITARQLQNTINENTRMLILNSPSNPTGDTLDPGFVDAVLQAGDGQQAACSTCVERVRINSSKED